MKKQSVAVLGDGGWGTTLSILLDSKGLPVTLWSAFPEYAEVLRGKRLNPKFLPGIPIPKRIEIVSDLKKALEGKDLVILAIPSEYIRGVLKMIKSAGLPGNASFVSVTKGIENRSCMRMSEVITDELGKLELAVLSGPTIAREVATGKPTTAVVASRSSHLADRIQDVFMTGRFRVYTSDDVTGVELGGSLKNVIAIACGISDGLGFGTNSKAALLSRGLSEMARLGKAMGAKEKTFSGISGLGDLVTTCFSEFSRNRHVGEEIGKGKKLQDIKARMPMVAEGVPTAQSGCQLGKKYRVDMPITEQVYCVLYRNKSPLRAVNELMARQKKAE